MDYKLELIGQIEEVLSARTIKLEKTIHAMTSGKQTALINTLIEQYQDKINADYSILEVGTSVEFNRYINCLVSKEKGVITNRIGNTYFIKSGEQIYKLQRYKLNSLNSNIEAIFKR
jgi:hypothetical protein